MHGFAQDRFASLRADFDRNVTGGADLGAAVSVTIDGRTVVDLRGGHAGTPAVADPDARTTLCYTPDKKSGAPPTCGASARP